MVGNAKIASTHLGYESHGILTCSLTLSQNYSYQVFGGYPLDDIPKIKGGARPPTLLAGFFIQRILETVGVPSWENLVGEYVRVSGDPLSNIFGIGNIIENKWFFPKREIKQFLK